METVLIAGGSGLVGSRLTTQLREDGYEVKVLTRNQQVASRRDGYLHWDIDKQHIDGSALSADHVVNLAGAGIADKKWSLKRKKEIIKSRTETTRLLIQFFRNKPEKLKSFVNASAMGYYGDCGDKEVREDDSPCTTDFLSEVCSIWEKSAAEAQSVAASVSILRISTVWSTRGGALPKMIQSIPFGVAPYFGDGGQYMSWIHIDDLCRMVSHLLGATHSAEIFNAATDTPATNKEVVKSLARVIQPHALVVPTPSLALKLAMGEMSRIVLNSCRMSVDKIVQTGFRFQFGDLERAVSDLRDRKI